MSAATSFHKLSDCPASILQYCNTLVAMNGTQYLATVYKEMDHDERPDNQYRRTRNYNRVTEDFTICKYSLHTDKWSKELTLDNVAYVHSGLSCDENTNTLYFMRNRQIRKVKLHRLREWRSTDFCNIYADFYVNSMILIGGNLHVFGTQNEEQCHGIIDTANLWKLIKYNSILDQECNGGAIEKIAFSKSQNSIIAFHGRETGSVLLEYSLNTKQWNALKWSSSDWKYHVEQTGMVMSSSGRYFLCFGGKFQRNGMSGGTNSIVIYDLKLQTARISSIGCPVFGGYHAVRVGDDLKSELLVFGFINRLFKTAVFRNVQVLPLHLIRLIEKWNCRENEYICLIARNKQSDNHWKIRMKDIIAS